KECGKPISYTDPVTGETYVPYVVEPSLGADRVVLAFLTDAYDEEVVDAEKNDVRTVLRLHPALAPYKCAVLPLQKNLSEKADEIYALMRKKFSATYDLTGSIGKRYRRQDEIGTPYCVTVDFQTLEDGTVTVRDRDSMEQIRVSVEDAIKYVEEKIEF
ncbi:MAG: His/Gly/Thr/Pro-type tRNA ligase C-terminal domain-containing protein, partial [Coriobacteriales bacterium]